MCVKVLCDVSNVDRYSFSKLSTIYQCPYSYDLYYNEKIEGEGNGFADCGSLVHSILERYFKGELLQFELVDTFINEFEEAVPEGIFITFESGFKKDMTEKYKEQCISYLESFSGFDDLEVISAEEKFDILVAINNKKIIFNGFIDAIAKDKNGDFYIIDHKSKANWKNKDELKKYTRQLYVYALYVKYKYGKYPKELWFNMFRANKIEKIKFSNEDFLESLNWISNTVEIIENEQFFEKKIDDFYCNNLCNYRNICDK